jgi:hypothetical protein
MNEDEMGRACGRVLVGKSVERDHLEDLGIDGKVILKWVLKNLGGGGGARKNWIRLTQGRDKWHAVVKLVVTVRTTGA